MKRTQLYLDDQDWAILQLRARESGQTVSELVRRAVRAAYSPTLARRKGAMEAVIGLRKDRSGLPETGAYVRELRSGKRLDRLEEQWRS
ncbi:MAG: ribbon-helix-helix protein, CopG family [Candidatus Solibacter sp.]